MRNKRETSPESIVREIKRKTRRKFSAEKKIHEFGTGYCVPNLAPNLVSYCLRDL